MTIQQEIRPNGLIQGQSDTQPPRTWQSWLIGRPLPSDAAPHQTIGKAVGLAVFASDALSSTAYASQEILGVLVLAGAAATVYSFPVALAIVTLLAIVTISYEQTIHAYPGGGGAYIVARDNLGEAPAQIAAAALLTDYILTVSVSVSSGVAQMVSAFPELTLWKAYIAIGMVLFIMLINLRGVKESGVTFAIPTYFFLVAMSLTALIGLVRAATGGLGAVVEPPEVYLAHELQPLSMFLILHAFANGTTALTGVEAISNGITAFKEPRSRNAGITLIWMSVILGGLFLSITFLAVQSGAVFSEQETVISQLARTIYSGRGLPYLAVIGATTLILIMAANTAFADFPRLGALAAADGFLPRQLTYKGSRLVFSRGIIVLAAIASLLIWFFDASVTALIPLYAIGVFLSFTLSQAGMAVRWWKSSRLKPGQTLAEHGSTLHSDPKWAVKLAVNGFGAVCTAVVMMVFAVTKFAEGAWIILIVVPALVAGFFAINRHYRALARSLSLDDYSAPARVSRHRVLVPVSGVHRGTLEALNYARSLSADITAIHISTDPAESEQVRRKWESWGDGARLVVLESPYRMMLEPLLEYIRFIAAQGTRTHRLTVVVPQFVPRHWWHNLLHQQTAVILRLALLNQRGIVVTDVPYHVE